MRTETQEAMLQLSRSFESAKRADGEAYTRLKDDCPEWIDSELMHRLHEAVDDRLPDDWIYESSSEIADSLCAYETVDEMYEAAHEVCDGLVDIMNGDLTRWLASSNLNAFLCDEAEEEFGPAGNMYDRIKYGQFIGLSRIAYALIKEIEQVADNDPVSAL